jgi:hypothetical protein
MFSQWQESLLAHLASLNLPETVQTVEFIRSRGVKIAFQKRNPSIGAFWDIWGNINLNSHYYSPQTSFNDIRMTCLVVHEALHLKQGFLTALSVLGELEAWQLDFTLYQKLNGHITHPAVLELLSLPLNRDRTTLAHVRELMQSYAGKGYRIDLLPLYPLFDEIQWRVFGKTAAAH